MERLFEDRVLVMREKMFRFASTILGDRDEACDVVQDVFERLWTRRSELTGVANVEGYVMSAVRNLCLDRIRSHRTREEKHELLRVQMPMTATIDVDHLDTMAIVRRAINSLPERQRETVHLRDIEGYEIEDIGAIIGADPPTVRVLLSRGRQRLREMLIELKAES